MAVFRGDWWAHKERPILKGIAEIDVGDIADSAVETDKIADKNVTSEKASTNVITKSFMAIAGNPTTSDAGFTSCTQLWRPLVDVTVRSIQHIAITKFVTASSGNEFLFYAGAGTSMGTVTLSTGNVAAGVRTAGSTLDVGYIAACTDLKAKFMTSTGAVPGFSGFQIDYTTTG